MTVTSGADVAIRIDARPPGDAAAATLTVETGADRLDRPLGAGSGAGTTTLRLVPSGPATAPYEVAVAERGTVLVTLSWGDTVASAAPQVRIEMQYRVVDDRVEILTPGLGRRHVWVKDHEEWRHEPTPELVVRSGP
jgi:hypothetical protein